MNLHRVSLASLLLVVSCIGGSFAEPPSTAYIFPAGGQRGTKVDVRIGGHYLHEKCPFEISGPGISGPAEIHRRDTIWFEGPIIRQPASQRAEDYPKDYAATLDIAADAPLGARMWRAWNSQGVTALRPFIVGDLPEVLEQEIDGEPIPTTVAWPVTINGRIFPREDVDLWRFELEAGKRISLVVAAQEFGSPLEARLELRDPRGRLVGEAVSVGKNDPVLHFTATDSGVHELRIHDVKYEGLQTFVYRLTISDRPWINAVYPLGGRVGTDTNFTVWGSGVSKKSNETTSVLTASLPQAAGDNATIFQHRFQIDGRFSNPVWLAADQLPEVLEVEPNDSSQQAAKVEIPSVANGRLQQIGDVDQWSFAATKGKPVSLEVFAARLGSPAQVMLSVRDEADKELLKADPLNSTNGDVQVMFNPPQDGQYVVAVRERFASRSGNTFAYRLRMVQAEPSVRIELPSDVVSVDRGKSQKLSVSVVRDAGFNVPVTLSVSNLPEGVKVADVAFPPNKPKGDLVFQAEPTAVVNMQKVKVVGRYQLDGKEHEVPATITVPRGEPVRHDLLLAVTMPTPFRFHAEFSMTFIPCGAMTKKRYTLDRGGFEGPLEVRLADRQGRHLQGVTGPMFTIPAGADEFEYPITLAPWMELGRTSRSMPMITGEVTDEQGRKHKVCFTTNEQNCQLVNIVSPSPLRVLIDSPALTVAPGSEVKLPVRIRRDKSMTTPIQIELVAPPHMRDINSSPVQLAANETETTLTIRFGSAPGPLNMPVVVRATGEWSGSPLTTETPIELVPAPAKNR